MEVSYTFTLLFCGFTLYSIVELSVVISKNVTTEFFNHPSAGIVVDVCPPVKEEFINIL